MKKISSSDKMCMESHGYTFRKSIGEGRYGKVVRVHSNVLSKDYALKIIKWNSAKQSKMSTFLARELDIVKCVQHPNIIQTYNIFEQETSSKVFVVMELCVNGDFSEYMKTKGPLSEECSRKFLAQLCAAVQYLHTINVTHRDLKCENLLLDQHNNIKVCDFGLSKRLTYTKGQLDLSHTFCGTNNYAAPEILRSIPYNPLVSDVWSMGVILFKMLYNALPFDSMNITKMVRLQMSRKINFLNTPHVSPPAVALIQSMLHPDTKHRIRVDSILKSLWMVQAKEVGGAKELPPPKVEPGQKTGQDTDDCDEGTSGL